MNPVMLVAALLAAAAVLLIFWGLFGARRRRRQRAPRALRLAGAPASERSEEKRKERSRSCEQLAGSRALTDFNQVVEKRDWGANLARELARADLALKPSEFLAIRVGAIVRHPGRRVSSSARPSLPASATRSRYVAGGRRRLLAAAVLARPPQERAASRRSTARLADTITLIANSLRAGSSFLQAIEMVVRETQPPISHRVRPRHPRGQPRPAVRAGAHQPGPPRPLGRPGADDHGHRHPAPGRRQPGRDPRLHRVHHPRARPHQGRDQDPHRAAAHVGLRRRLPAHRPAGHPLGHRAPVHGPDVREATRAVRAAARACSSSPSAGS